MHLAKVIGRVVATKKHEALEGVKLLLIQPVDHEGTPKSEPIVATDPFQAGEGETVVYVTGREAALALDETFTPVDAGIVGIVDSINHEEG
ncbi:EutN-like protein clustered with choline trimethylamine-lyase [hydrothermal vent metagenome]|uniref:EutN-like protein clustered with choline trimethylamine-lyase n=1 Tax=hydrothermal vent metagenome TaxID=652676 RepID=A0A3B1C480_9ZZZZ